MSGFAVARLNATEGLDDRVHGIDRRLGFRGQAEVATLVDPVDH